MNVQDGQSVSHGRSGERLCPTCGVGLCDVRVKGEWIECEWPPLIPVIDVRNMVVAFDGGYADPENMGQKAKFTYDGFEIGHPAASMLMRRHNCEAIVRYTAVLTEHGRRAMEGERG
jgi:hypothetical protein